MNRWKNMRRGMTVILTATMVGQSLPAYAGDFETEIETESVESEAENDFSDSTEQESETDIASVSPESEQDDQIELDREMESDGQTDTDEVVTVEENTEIFDDDENAEDEETGSADARENGIIDYGTCSEGLTWTLNSEGVLRIDGEGTITKENIYFSKQGKDHKNQWTFKEYYVKGKEKSDIEAGAFTDHICAEDYLQNFKQSDCYCK